MSTYALISCSDTRSALTLYHIADLVRISQQRPEFQKISEINWPFDLQEMLPNSHLNDFIDQIIRYLAHKPNTFMNNYSF